MRPLSSLFALLAFPLLASAVSAASAAPAAQPVAPVHDVVDHYWGVDVHDPYRDLENLKSPVVQAWFKGQADYTDSVLSRIPIRDELLARIEELDAGRPFRVGGIQRAAGQLFYLKTRAEDNLSKLYTRGAAGGEERLLIDPATVASTDGGHFSIAWYVPSPDGRRVVYGLAPSGSENDVLHVLDVASGKALPDVIEEVEAGYTPPQWLADGSGFFYSRLQHLAPGAPATDGYKLSRACLHRLGANSAADPVVFAKDLWPNVAMADVDFPSIVLEHGSLFAIGKIKHGDSNPLTLYAAPLGPGADLSKRGAGASPWQMVCDVADSVTDFAVHGGDIYLMTAKGAPRFKVVGTSLVAPSFARAETVVPPGERVVDGLSASKDALYIQFRHGGAGEVARLGWEAGAKLQPLTLPDGFPSARISAAGAGGAGVLVETAAWTRAGLTYAYEPAKNTFTDTQLNPRGKFDDVAGFESVEVEVPSHDGVLVPLSIIYRAGTKLDGSNPTYLTGYGSYGISRNVGFSPTLIAWLERGGVYAVSHVRGGGENGDAWHLAGQKLNKPNTWKDFIACAQYLVARGYTSPGKLAGQGGSAGGILIGRAITERPDLFRAALLDVGSLDAVRAEFTTNGVPNIQEFGTVTRADEFRGLLEMSAYHHVKPGEKYPAVMVSHGINDPRVEPWMSGKMAASLQAATSSARPVLLRVDYHAGHGIGSTKHQMFKGLADRYAFLLWQMELVKPLP